MPDDLNSTMMNSPEARTETGEIKDANSVSAGDSASVSKTPTSTESNTPTSGAPESYSDFTVPEGQTLDKALIEGASPIFKELNLSQDQAQKLVDFYNTQTKSASDAAIAAVEKLRSDWRDQTKADATIGPKLDSVLVEIGRAKDKLPIEVRQAFSEAMDFTGAGDHPAIVRAFYELAKLVNEGTHVAGKGPSVEGQNSKGQTQRPTIAGSLYPNLPH